MKPSPSSHSPQISPVRIAFALVGASLALGACTSEDVATGDQPTLTAELGTRGASLVVSDLADLISATEPVFLRTGDQRLSLSRSTEWLTNNRGETAEVQAWSVSLEPSLLASLEANHKLTVEVGSVASPTRIATVVVDDESFEIDESTDTANLCYNDPRNRSYVGYYGSHFRIVDRASGLTEWFCSYRGIGDYPSGRRYRYRCGRCAYP